MIVRDFQSVIGRETITKARTSSADCPIWSWRVSAAAAMRRGCFIHSSNIARSNSWESRLAGVRSTPAIMRRPCRLVRPVCVARSYSYVMQDEDGQTSDVHSVSAGLDYPGVGPEHSYWKDSGERGTRSAKTKKRCQRLTLSLVAKAFCRRSKVPTPSPKRSKKQPDGRKIRSWSCVSRVAATKTRSKSPGSRGIRSTESLHALHQPRTKHHEPSTLPRMSAIDELFQRTRAERRKAFIPFVTAGDPDLEFTVDVLATLVERGADVCEVGFRTAIRSPMGR